MGAVAAHRMSQRGGLARKMLFRKLDPATINSTDPLSGEGASQPICKCFLHMKLDLRLW